jgi:hypothetical protein
MGYRSDIKAVFYTTDKEAWPVLKLYVDENFPEGDKEHLRVIRGKYITGYLFEVDGWKWYDSYPEVIAFNRFVSNLLELADGDDDGPPWCYEFARVGEDYEDLEVNRSNKAEQYVLNFARSIEVDF